MKTPLLQVLPEADVTEVEEFVLAAFEAVERTEGQPAMLFARTKLDPAGYAYRDFNIRSRHFRCIETFFIAGNDAGQIEAVVAVDGLNTQRPTQLITLVAYRCLANGQDVAWLAALLDQLPGAIQEYTKPIKLRVAMVYDRDIEQVVFSFADPHLEEVLSKAGFKHEITLTDEYGRNKDAQIYTRFLIDPDATETPAK